MSATVFTGKCNFRCGFCHNSSLVLDYNSLSVIDEREVLSYLEKRKGILEGLCITGGEPTLEKDLALFMEKVKKIGYSVKLDTNGTDPQAVKTFAESGLCDYFAVDIKNDRQNYGQVIGISGFKTDKVEKTVEYLITSCQGRYEFRTTAIKEYHKAENFIGIAEWINGADKYFIQKFKAGDNTIIQGLSPLPKEDAQTFLGIVSKAVKSAKLRGYD